MKIAVKAGPRPAAADFHTIKGRTAYVGACRRHRTAIGPEVQQNVPDFTWLVRQVDAGDEIGPVFILRKGGRPSLRSKVLRFPCPINPRLRYCRSRI
jgi:hypothetical protein